MPIVPGRPSKPPVVQTMSGQAPPYRALNSTMTDQDVCAATPGVQAEIETIPVQAEAMPPPHRSFAVMAAFEYLRADQPWSATVGGYGRHWLPHAPEVRSVQPSTYGSIQFRTVTFWVPAIRRLHDPHDSLAADRSLTPG